MLKIKIMTKEKKQEFTNRIINANKSDMIVILYDMTLVYIEEAKENSRISEIVDCLKKAKNCIDELKQSVNLGSDVGIKLYSIYSYLNKLLSQIIAGGNKQKLADCEKILISMRDTWEKVAKKDASKPVMENAETIAAGYTYGKNDLNLNPVAFNNRGFLV